MIRLLLVLALLSVAGAAQCANPAVRDDEGRLLALAAPPQRIVSLAPGAFWPGGSPVGPCASTWNSRPRRSGD